MWLSGVHEAWLLGSQSAAGAEFQNPKGGTVRMSGSELATCQTIFESFAFSPDYQVFRHIVALFILWE
jgi:hypothetical protein